MQTIDDKVFGTALCIALQLISPCDSQQPLSVGQYCLTADVTNLSSTGLEA